MMLLSPAMPPWTFTLDAPVPTRLAGDLHADEPPSDPVPTEDGAEAPA